MSKKSKTPVYGLDLNNIFVLALTSNLSVPTDHNIYKRRLDLEGNPIEEAKKEEILTSSTAKENVVSIESKNAFEVDQKLILFLLSQTEGTSLEVVVKCGSCYGAQVNETHCCNTCQVS